MNKTFVYKRMKEKRIRGRNMLKLPNEFQIRIINRYGQEGKKWLENINNIVDTYADKMNLEDIKLLEKLSMNVIAFARTHQYGEVVLKIGAPGVTSESEIKVMKNYSTQYIPKCYYSSIEDRVMLLEKISPGYSLNNLKNKEERIKVFSNIADGLLNPTTNMKKFQTFEELFSKKIEYASLNKKDYSEIMWMIPIAQEMYSEIKKMKLPQYILHDDLHHKNILKAEDGWKAIDPHGIIGERVFETSHFIRAELEQVNIEEDEVEEIVSLLEKYYREDKYLILKALYINLILKVIWYIKNKYEESIISYNRKICETILKILEIKKEE